MDPFNENPYAPATATDAEELKRSRPVSVKVFGFINLVLGVLGILGTIGSAVLMFGPPLAGVPNPTREIMQTNTPFYIFMIFSMIVGPIFCIVLIAAGVGLLRWQDYGRRFSVLYGIYAIIMAIVSAIMNFAFVLLPMFASAAGNSPAERAGLIGGIIGGVIGALFSLLHPVLLLYFMTRPRVIEALRPRDDAFGARP